MKTNKYFNSFVFSRKQFRVPARTRILFSILFKNNINTLAGIIGPLSSKAYGYIVEVFVLLLE